MTLFRTVEPAVEPVTLVEAKQHLRIDHASEDELVSGLIRAAREEVEAGTALALINQSWRLALDELPCSGIVRLRRGQVRAITSITVYGSEGEASLVDPSDYQLDALSRPSRLHIRKKLEPAISMNGIEIDFEAGFGEVGTDVPDLLKRAVLTLVAHWYEFRAAYRAKDQPISFPPGYDRLIAPYLMRRL